MQAIVSNYGVQVFIADCSHRFQIWAYPGRPIARIVLKYRRNSALRPAIAAPAGCFCHEISGKSRQQALQVKDLLNFNIAGAGVHVQQHAAVSNLALDMVVAERALHRDWMVDLERS